MNFSPLTSEITRLMFTHQNQIFRKAIFRPLGGAAPPSLTSAPPTGGGDPLTTFFKGESKIGLKCNKGALITSELGGVARRNFGTLRKYEIRGQRPL